jgi:hypothetical protein
MKRTGRAIELSALGALVILAIVGPLAGSVWAQDQSQGQNWFSSSLRSSVVGSNTPFLDFREKPGPFEGLSISGFLSNTTGMWVNSDGIRYQYSKNSLATQRDWIQLDINYVLNGNNRFFIRWWGIYEPPYPFEEAGPGLPNAAALATPGRPGCPTCFAVNDMSDYYDQYTVRDAYWKSTMGPLTLFLGRQIVTWGESLAFRVGDVINPQDFTWNFGFANLEQSRLPLYMVHPIYKFPDFAPFTANFAEGIWAPAWQPMYTQVDFPNQDPTNPHSNPYDGQHDVAGEVSLLAPIGRFATPLARFETYPYPGTSGPAFPQLVNFSSPFFGYHLPGDTLGNSVEGFRLHSVVENSEVTLIYWHGHQFNEGGTPGAPGYIVGSPSTGQIIQIGFPQFNDIGATMNRPIYLPGNLLSNIPFVVRTEGIFQDRTPFNTTDVAINNAVVDKSTFNTLVALDMDGLYVPWLTHTGTLTTNLEWNNYTISGYGSHLVYPFYAERWRHNEEQILFDASTSWHWGAVVPTYVMIWNPSGNTTLLFPNVVLTPPWTNKYFMMLEYIGILGNDKFNSFAGGTFKGKSILLMQFQYNFILAQGKS